MAKIGVTIPGWSFQAGELLFFFLVILPFFWVIQIHQRLNELYTKLGYWYWYIYIYIMYMCAYMYTYMVFTYMYTYIHTYIHIWVQHPIRPLAARPLKETYEWTGDSAASQYICSLYWAMTTVTTAPRTLIKFSKSQSWGWSFFLRRISGVDEKYEEKRGFLNELIYVSPVWDGSENWWMDGQIGRKKQRWD